MSRRRLGLTLTALAVVLVAVGSCAHHSATYVWGDRLDHVFVLGVIAALVGAAGWALLVRRPWLLAVGVVVAAGWGWLGHELGPDVVQLTERAPAGADYEAFVVRPAASLNDQVWVRQTSGGLLARQWQAGCLSSDSGDTGLGGLTWLSDDRLQVGTNYGIAVLIVDADGRPHRVPSRAWGCGS